MNQLISVIIPVYNSEKYLNKCLTSILTQTYSNIEVIIINDGSNDNSLSICEKFKEKDNRIRIITQENKGVSYSRNRGIREALGDYIMFVDSDDFISNNYIELMYKETSQNNYEVCISGMTFCDENEKVIKTELYKNYNIELNFGEIIPSIINTIYFCSSCKTLFKRDIILKNKILFNNKLKFGEDFKFSFDALRNSKKTGYLSFAGYFYRENRNSSTQNKDIDVIKQYLQDSLDVLAYINTFTKNDTIIYNRMFSKLNLALRKVCVVDKITYKNFKKIYDDFESIFNQKAKIKKVNIKMIDYETKVNKILLYLLKKNRINLYYKTNKLINKIKIIIRKLR